MTGQPVQTIHIGYEVSKDTLRDSDLLRAFSDCLALVKPDHWSVAEARRILRRYGDFGYSSSLYSKSIHQGKTRKVARDMAEEIDILLWETLWEQLNLIAPEKSVFSAHPGNNSLFGFWDQDMFGFEN